MDSSYISIYISVLTVFVILSLAEKKRRAIRRRKQKARRGEKSMMSEDLIREFIGKTVIIQVEGMSGFSGVLVAVEGNWLKLEEKKAIRLINVDMITHIKVAKQK